jgi:hypothetical protein
MCSAACTRCFALARRLPPLPSACCPSPYTAVVDGEIKQVSLADYKGKYVILFFYPKDFT